MRSRDSLRDISVGSRTVVSVQFPTFQRNIMVPETPGTNCPEMWHCVSTEWNPHVSAHMLGNTQNTWPLQVLLVMTGILTMVTIVNYWLVIPVFVMGFFFYKVRGIYVATAQDVKRLEGTSKSLTPKSSQPFWWV